MKPLSSFLLTLRGIGFLFSFDLNSLFIRPTLRSLAPDDFILKATVVWLCFLFSVEPHADAAAWGSSVGSWIESSVG